MKGAKKLTPQVRKDLTNMTFAYLVIPKTTPREYIYCRVYTDSINRQRDICNHCGKLKSLRIMRGKQYVIIVNGATDEADLAERFFPNHTEFARTSIASAKRGLQICDECAIKLWPL